jgi:hypothetical protein
VVRPCRWAWAGRGVAGQGGRALQTGPWLLKAALLAPTCKHPGVNTATKPVWPGPAPRRAGASGLPAKLPGRFSGGARPTRLPFHGRPAPLTRPFYAWPHPAFLCAPKRRRGDVINAFPAGIASL